MSVGQFKRLPIVANQHLSRRTIQVSRWLHIRKTKLVLLCGHLNGWSCCYDQTAFWFTSRVKEAAPKCESTHVIHREMLASRKFSPELNSVLNYVIKIINHIKAHALNSRLFKQLCEEMDAEHKYLFIHTEVRWLFKGRSLARVF